MSHAETITIRFRWWALPLTRGMRALVVLLGAVTPRSWHLRLVNLSAGAIAHILTRYGMVVQ